MIFCDEALTASRFCAVTTSPVAPPKHNATMAEAAGSGTPTFKLVLVGDGGTGKVRLKSSGRLCAVLRHRFLSRWRGALIAEQAC